MNMIIYNIIMFECSACGKTYKFQGGLNNHKQRCGAAAAGGGVAAAAAAPKYTQADLENLQKQNQARLNTLIEAQKAAAAASAAASAGASNNSAGSGSAAGPASTTTVVTNNTSNVGNEEHNASFNINYIKRSEETQEVVRAVTAAANEFCKGRIIVTSDEPAPGCTSITGISTSVNENGTTVYNHPTRTISIIETPPEEVSPEEQHDITLEKMTYLILSLIQKNNKLTKENQMLRLIVSKIDPACFEDD
jgi:type II secretory pathway pseudopilin PulG